MLIEDFKSEFGYHVEQGDLKSASNSLMEELGRIFVRNRNDFADLLKGSEIQVNDNATDKELVDLFVQNIGTNKKLNLGAALLVATHNKAMGFDGDYELDDELVKLGYKVISANYADEDTSNAGGAILGAISGITQAAGSVATKAMEGQQKKKYGAMDLAAKKQEAKAAITQQIIAANKAKMELAQKEKEEKAKTTKTILIVGGAIVALAIIGFIIYKVKKK